MVTYTNIHTPYWIKNCGRDNTCIVSVTSGTNHIDTHTLYNDNIAHTVVAALKILHIACPNIQRPWRIQ